MSRGGNKETYYDILNVPKDCSEKDIRNAFINLSKQFHPDVRNSQKVDSKSSTQFLKISEAYQVLSKPHLRRDYDQTLRSSHRYVHVHDNMDSNTPPIFRPWEIRPDYNPHATNENYYGVKGINRVSNMKIGAFLLLVSLLSGIVGISSAKRSYHVTSARMNENSLKNIEMHRKLREEVQQLTKDEQVRRVTNRLYAGKPMENDKKLITIQRQKTQDRNTRNK